MNLDHADHQSGALTTRPRCRRAQLAILLKEVDKELNETEELLSLQCMKDTTTGANIFSEVLNAFDKFNLDLSTSCGIATDDARAMSGTGIGFVGLLKSALKEKNISDNIAIFSLHHSSIKSMRKILEI